MKTILISNPEIREIPESRNEIIIKSMELPHLPIPSDDVAICETYGQVREELVKARYFERMRKDGERDVWLVGFPKDLCEILEILPTREYEELERLRKLNAQNERHLAVKEDLIAAQEDLIAAQEDLIAAVQTAPWYVRLKWLFTGIKA